MIDFATKYIEVKMKIKRVIAGELEANCYIICPEDSNEAFMIDPGYDEDEVLSALKEDNLKLKGILLTHYHSDHSGAVDGVLNEADAPVYIHCLDKDIEACKAEPDVLLSDGDILELGNYHIRVMHTPGHSRGSACYYVLEDDIAFTGDTIFNIDLGATIFNGGSHKEMRDSCKNVIDEWEDDVFIYPGHGDGCTMKWVRENNREFMEIINEV